MLSLSVRRFSAALLAVCAGTAAANPWVFGDVRFTVLTPECVRIEQPGASGFVDAPSIFAVRTLPVATARHAEDGGRQVLDTGRMRIEYLPDGRPLSSANLRVTIGQEGNSIVWTPASRQTGNLGGTINTLDQVKGPVSLEEGILSRDGWYLIDDSKGHLLVDGWVKPRPADSGTDWFLLGYGSDYAAAFRGFTAAGGAVPMPRKPVLGSWYSRWWKYTTKDYKDIVREYARHDFPLDIMVMDMEWHTEGWTGWSWNYDLLDDPPALLKWFRNQGLAVTLNVHPADGVQPKETMYADFMKAMDADPATKQTIPFDAGDRRYMETWFRLTHHPREEEGVDFWWLDWQQYPEVKSVPGLLNLTWLNKLYFENSMRTGRRGLQFSRWGAWGDHRHPIHFSGDADTGWAMLGFEVPFTSTAASEGAYFWSHDIGGHFGARNEEPYTRWVQFASTTAAMRLHSGIIPYLDRRPWMWPEWATESMREAFHLRSELMPYVYSAVRKTHETSLPLNRPMYVEWPEVEDAYAAPQQYLFGSELLVAPVASAGFGPGRVASQLVWFPAGEWRNWFTSESFQGPQWRLVSADINEFPLYVRAGTPIPAQPYSARPTTESLDELVVHLWPSLSGDHRQFVLYEDDGDSREYERGAFAKTLLTASTSGGTTTLTIAPPKGTYKGQPERRGYRLVLHGVKRPGGATVDNRAARVAWDEESRTATVRVGKRRIDRATRIVVTASGESPEYFAQRAETRRLRGIVPGASGLAEAIAGATAADSEVLPGLLALAGVGVVENGTHYPEVGTLARLVRNADSPIAADGIRVGWERVLSPKDAVVETTTADLGGFSGLAPLAQPKWAPANLEFLQSATDSRSLTVPFGGRAVTATVPLATTWGQAREWYISPTVPFDRARDIADQPGPAESLAQEILAMPEKLEGWKRVQAGKGGLVDLMEARGGEGVMAYAVAAVDVPEAIDTTLSFRSDDGIEVWLNGEKLHSKHAFRGLDHTPETVAAHFRKGRNVLLVKVSQDEFGWGFIVMGGGAPPAEK